MKFNFEFSSIVGATYQNGNVVFSPDNQSVFSPVGNNVSVVRLKRDETSTLEVNSSYNIEFIAISPRQHIAICVNEYGYASVISLTSGDIINCHNFRQKINYISFSPSGKILAVARGNLVFVYHAPRLEKPHIQFKLIRVSKGASSDVTCIDWTTNSKYFVAGSMDNSTRVYSIAMKPFVVYSLGGNYGAIVKSFFMKDSLDCFSISSNGQCCFWQCNKPMDILESELAADTNTTKDDSEEETKQPSVKRAKKIIVTYEKKSKNHFFVDIEKGHKLNWRVTAVDFNKLIKLVVTGFENGQFMIHEMPNFSPRQIVEMANAEITTISFNNDGSWIAVGCKDHCQLSVWCWRSQSYIFQSQGHIRSAICCLDYSPDGNYLATGGHDGKLKLWLLNSGRCRASFGDHTGPISGVCFPAKKCKTIFSSSLDGSVRGYDVVNLKNFCILNPEERTYQLTCIASDDNGEFVAAGGGADCFSVMVWQARTRTLIYTLGGHAQPVVTLQFAPITAGAFLVSGSWDKSMRIWQLQSEQSKEVLQTDHDIIAVAVRPDGKEIAAALVDASIVFYDPRNGEQQPHMIDGKFDLGMSKQEGELVTSKKAAEEKMFQSLSYSPNGELILAAGNSKFICLYSAIYKQLLRRYPITCNLSLEGVQEAYDRRRITQWGFSDVHIDMASNKRSLPGVARDNDSRRSVKIEASVSCIKFSPTGMDFASASTEGVLVFSTDQTFHRQKYLGGAIDFSQLDAGVTPDSVRSALAARNFVAAVSGALRLRDVNLLATTITSVPDDQVQFIIGQLRLTEVGMTLLRFLTKKLKACIDVGLYTRWLHCALLEWTDEIKTHRSTEFRDVGVDIRSAIEMLKSRMKGGILATGKITCIEATALKARK